MAIYRASWWFDTASKFHWFSAPDIDFWRSAYISLLVGTRKYTGLQNFSDAKSATRRGSRIHRYPVFLNSGQRVSFSEFLRLPLLLRILLARLWLHSSSIWAASRPWSFLPRPPDKVRFRSHWQNGPHFLPLPISAEKYSSTVIQMPISRPLLIHTFSMNLASTSGNL